MSFLFGAEDAEDRRPSPGHRGPYSTREQKLLLQHLYLGHEALRHRREVVAQALREGCEVAHAQGLRDPGDEGATRPRLFVVGAVDLRRPYPAHRLGDDQGVRRWRRKGAQDLSYPLPYRRATRDAKRDVRSDPQPDPSAP